MREPRTTSPGGQGLNGFGPNGRSTVRLVLSLGVAFAAALALYLYQPGWFVIATRSPAPRAVPTATPRPKPPPDPGIGGSHVVDNVKVTLLDVQYTRGSRTNEPNKGFIYAIITLKVENHQGKDYPFVPAVTCPVQFCNFYIGDSLGEKNPPVGYDPYHTQLRPVVLRDGGYEVGSLTFQVPEHDNKLQLIYYYAPLADANNVQFWQLDKRATHGR